MTGWKHSETFHDWLLFIQLPNGHIRGAVSFTNRKPQDHSAWGTIESTAGDKFEMSVEKYDHPSAAVDAVTGDIISLMATIITNLVQPPEPS